MTTKKQTPIEKEIERASRLVAKALKGFNKVTFHLDLTANHHPDQPRRFSRNLIQSRVTLWFYHSFPVTVTGGQDFKLLAIHVREKAKHGMRILKNKGFRA